MENEIKRLDQRIDRLQHKIDVILEYLITKPIEVSFDTLSNFIENQFYGLLKNRIIAYAKEHNGLTEKDIRENIAFKNDRGEINGLDWYVLYSTFLFMKKNKQFNEVHRGKGRPIIYKVIDQ